MKTVICSVLSLLFSFPFFAQEMENSFYENGTDVGGDALIMSSFVEVNSNNSVKEVSENKYLDDKLYIMGSQGVITDDTEPDDLCFTEDHIISYDLSTKIIIFTDSVYNEIIHLWNKWIFHYHFCLNDKLLLKNVSAFSKDGSFGSYSLALYWDTYDTFVLMYREVPDELEGEYWDGIREIINSYKEQQKEGFDTFIQHLRNVGKIIGENTNVELITPHDLNNIEIYPNPTTGELRIRKQRSALANYETTFSVCQLGIEGVEIYDIMGKKLSTVNYQLSTVNSIDISHLPSGIYFVKITTEKEVVTKKVVKK